MPNSRRDDADVANIDVLEKAVVASGEGRHDAAASLIGIAQAGEAIRIRRELQTLNNTLHDILNMLRNRF